MATLFTVTRAGATLDLNDGTNFELVEYHPRRDGNDTAIINVVGSTVNAAHDNLIALGRFLEGALDDDSHRRIATLSTPTLFNYRPDGASNPLRSPLFGMDWGRDPHYRIDDNSDSKKRLLGVNLSIKRAPYFEESAATQLFASASRANTGASALLSAANMRGDKPAALIIEGYPSVAGMTALAAFVRQRGTVANHFVWIETDSGAGGGLYTVAFNTGTAGLADANLSNGNGARVTPTNSNLDKRITITFPAANLIDLVGYKHILVRCRNNHGSNVNAFLIQARFGVDNGGTVGGYGDFTLLRAPSVVGGTTQLPLLFLGGAKFPPQDTAGAATKGAVLEIWGKSTLTSGFTTFDIDAVVLADGMGGHQSGFCYAAFPQAMGTGGAVRGVLNASDVQGESSAYLVNGSGEVLFGAKAMRGAPLFVMPDADAKVYVLSSNSAGQLHHLGNNQLVISARFRYSIARGTL